MPWVDMPSMRSGFYPGGRELEALVDQIAKITSPPMAILTRTAAFSMTNGASTAVPFDTETLDTYSAHDTVTNPSRYTSRLDGYYQVSGGIAYSNNATGIRTAQFAKNGTDITGSQCKLNAVTGGVVTAIPAWTATVLLLEGDYVELLGFQNSGAGLNTSTEANNLPTMYVRWVSET